MKASLIFLRIIVDVEAWALEVETGAGAHLLFQSQLTTGRALSLASLGKSLQEFVTCVAFATTVLIDRHRDRSSQM